MSYHAQPAATWNDNHLAADGSRLPKPTQSPNTPFVTSWTRPASTANALDEPKGKGVGGQDVKEETHRIDSMAGGDHSGSGSSRLPDRSSASTETTARTTTQQNFTSLEEFSDFTMRNLADHASWLSRAGDMFHQQRKWNERMDNRHVALSAQMADLVGAVNGLTHQIRMLQAPPPP